VTWLVCIVYTGSISSDVLRGAAGGIGIYNMSWGEGGILFLTVVVYYSRPSVSIYTYRRTKCFAEQEVLVWDRPRYLRVFVLFECSYRCR